MKTLSKIHSAISFVLFGTNGGTIPETSWNS